MERQLSVYVCEIYYLVGVPGRSQGGGLLLLQVCRGRRGRIEEGVPAQRSVCGGGGRVRVSVVRVKAGPANVALPAESEATAEAGTAAAAVVARHDETSAAVVHHALDEGRRAVADVAAPLAPHGVAHVLGVGDSDEAARRSRPGCA